MTSTTLENTPADVEVKEVDAVVVGAGFAGLYMVHRLRTAGMSVVAIEAGDDVGGTWYWNRYPGARCDIPTTDYTFTFDPELEKEWTWSEKYATQPEILSYARHVADRYGLRENISFSTRVTGAVWDDTAKRWQIETDRGARYSCRFYVMATGCLSMPKEPDIEGAGQFRGEVYFTNRWPHEGVDFSGKKVAVIGTGSSGIQSIPLIAKEAAQLTVFQRTANYSIPAHNGPPEAARLEALATDRDTYRREGRYSRAGVPRHEPTLLNSVTSTPEEIRARFEWAWEAGELLTIGNVLADQAINERANEMVAELVREKIRSIVKDPETAEALCPKDHPIGSKRPCLDTNYFQTYNLPHVKLVDLRKHPIRSITATGIDTVDESMEFDAIVFATGFDAMTGALVAVDITGRNGVTLKEKWADGPTTYLGLTTTDFPNFFAITGPGSPSVLSNMAVSIEQHVDWVADCVTNMRDKGFDTIEPTPLAQAGWDQHVQDCVAITLMPKANSWYMGANVPGKPRVFYPYIGGVDAYRLACEEVVAKDYLGFKLEGPAGTVCHDGVVRQLQPDVAMVLDVMSSLGLPPMESLSPEEARGFMAATAATRMPGPDVHTEDGVLPGPAGDLPYRLYRPAGDGPHPVITYFHGGGWVLGDLDSDDPLCRDLCHRTGAVVVSVNYRHAPENRFPAAADDAFAALQWIGANAIELGGIPGQLIVAGWSAGGNVAAVAAQRARDAGGPDLVGQVLLTPVTEGDNTRESYAENGEGYILTKGLMDWFVNHYIDAQDRDNPLFAPLKGELAGLAPAVVMTAQFDPLRDEGDAYAEALEKAGVPVTHIRARGHTHTSWTMVDVVISGAAIRAEIADAVSDLLRGASSN